MRKYEKIETVFQRDINGSKKLLDHVFRNSTVEFLAKNDWIWTEKIDGTNIRIFWDGYKVTFGGRTDNAAIPATLINKLNEIFGTEEAAQIFEQTWGEREVILFGEGYGTKIQKVGSAYLPDDVGFILFDVLVGDNYQERPVVESVAKMFNIPVVPIIIIGPIDVACNYMKTHPMSMVAEGRCEMEGLVGRPAVEVRDRCGNRIIVKVKWCDIKELI